MYIYIYIYIYTHTTHIYTLSEHTYITHICIKIFSLVQRDKNKYFKMNKSTNNSKFAIEVFTVLYIYALHMFQNLCFFRIFYMKYIWTYKTYTQTRIYTHIHI